MNFKALSVLALSGLGDFDELVRGLEWGMVLKSEVGVARFGGAGVQGNEVRVIGGSGVEWSGVKWGGVGESLAQRLEVAIFFAFFHGRL
jgi:hypothetical protein